MDPPTPTPLTPLWARLPLCILGGAEPPGGGRKKSVQKKSVKKGRQKKSSKKSVQKVVKKIGPKSRSKKSSKKSVQKVVKKIGPKSRQKISRRKRMGFAALLNDAPITAISERLGQTAHASHFPRAGSFMKRHTPPHRHCRPGDHLFFLPWVSNRLALSLRNAYLKECERAPDHASKVPQYNKHKLLTADYND